MSIEFNAITKQFGSTCALDEVTLTLEPGHIYGLLGNNGAGKSTLLSILTDRRALTVDSVLVDGQPVKNNDHALHKVFLVGEQNFFPEDMKVKRAFRTMAYFYPEFDLDYAQNLAQQFGLSTKKKITALSTGYASIFRLILGLSVNTPYVVFDEPVLGLDASTESCFTVSWWKTSWIKGLPLSSPPISSMRWKTSSTTPLSFGREKFCEMLPQRNWFPQPTPFPALPAWWTSMRQAKKPHCAQLGRAQNGPPAR